jgi:hypothetical protein
MEKPRHFFLNLKMPMKKLGQLQKIPKMPMKEHGQPTCQKTYATYEKI